jgi:hypothetical protein
MPAITTRTTTTHSLRSSLTRAALGAVAVLALLLASDYAFVALYSHVMQPGLELAHYQEFAQLTAPPFATVLGLFVSYLVASWVIGGAANPWPRALLLVAACATLDAALVAAMGLANELLAVPSLLGELAKLVGAGLAAWTMTARRNPREGAAPSPARA